MTRSAPRRLIAVGQGLSRMSFRLVPAPGTVAWNQGTVASVIFVPHSSPCPDCDQYAQWLGSASEALKGWGTRTIVLVAPEGTTAVPGCLVAADDSGAGRALIGVDTGQAALVQTDRWGAVYQVMAIPADAAAHRELPTPEEIVGLAQFIDIQCPECAVPSKEWMASSPFPLG